MSGPNFFVSIILVSFGIFYFFGHPVYIYMWSVIGTGQYNEALISIYEGLGFVGILFYY